MKEIFSVDTFRDIHPVLKDLDQTIVDYLSSRAFNHAFHRLREDPEILHMEEETEFYCWDMNSKEAKHGPCISYNLLVGRRGNYEHLSVHYYVPNTYFFVLPETGSSICHKVINSFESSPHIIEKIELFSNEISLEDLIQLTKQWFNGLAISQENINSQFIQFFFNDDYRNKLLLTIKDRGIVGSPLPKDIWGQS